MKSTGKGAKWRFQLIPAPPKKGIKNIPLVKKKSLLSAIWLLRLIIPNIPMVSDIPIEVDFAYPFKEEDVMTIVSVRQIALMGN